MYQCMHFFQSDNCSDDDDPDYKPQNLDGENSDDSDESSTISDESITIEVVRNDPIMSTSGSCATQKDSPIGCEPITSTTSTDSHQTLFVEKANNSDHRVWDKKQCCPYCLKLFPKLPRHLTQKHITEIDVASALAFPKKSSERRSRLDDLRNRGNYAHNIEAIKTGEGAIIPYRRPAKDEDTTTYTPCSHCLAFFKKEDLWKHVKHCPKNQKKGMHVPPHGHQQASAALLPVADTASAKFKCTILDTMALDQIALTARTDALITTFGLHMYAKNGHVEHQHQYIKQKMRELARFLIAHRELDPTVKTLNDSINPTKFSSVVKAVKTVSGYDENSCKYSTPSLALKLGHSLKKCGRYIRSEALQCQDESLKKRGQDFCDLCEVEWTTQVSSQALSTLHENRYNRPKRIPLAQDLKLLNSHLHDKATELSAQLEKDPDKDTWRELAEVTLAQTTLFNRRRGGEMQRLTIVDYNNGISNTAPPQEEVLQSLSAVEVKLLGTLARIEMRGKHGRKVAVLLTEKLQRQLRLLHETRDQYGEVDPASPFVFARAGSCKTPLRCSDVLRKFASACGAEMPRLLTSTSLRKHIAVVTQLLNLKENELDVIARFMGHDVRVHREFYRLPEDTLELVKVSKLLLNIEAGNLHKCQGKSLDEITVNEDGM